MARIPPDVHMHPCHVNCHANFKYHDSVTCDKITWSLPMSRFYMGTATGHLFMPCAYIIPFHVPAVNIALPHAYVPMAPPRGKHARKFARERGLDFGGSCIVVGRCGNQSTTFSISIRLHTIGRSSMLQNVTQPGPSPHL